MVLEKTLESPLDCKEIQQVHPNLFLFKLTPDPVLNTTGTAGTAGPTGSLVPPGVPEGSPPGQPSLLLRDDPDIFIQAVST